MRAPDAHGQWRGYSPWGNRFLFTGREWLRELGMYDFRNRLYQPELGRFMQPDPNSSPRAITISTAIATMIQ